QDVFHQVRGLYYAIIDEDGSIGDTGLDSSNTNIAGAPAAPTAPTVTTDTSVPTVPTAPALPAPDPTPPAVVAVAPAPLTIDSPGFIAQDGHGTPSPTDSIALDRDHYFGDPQTVTPSNLSVSPAEEN
ncbi:hypothetical protein FRB94_008470, partial [Tulasnella sp. JGI-2019a]